MQQQKLDSCAWHKRIVKTSNWSNNKQSSYAQAGCGLVVVDDGESLHVRVDSLMVARG